MKRLLMMMLVLGIASVANAVLIQVDGQDPGQTVDIAEGITSVISIVSEVASGWLGYIIIEEGVRRALSGAAKLDAAGDGDVDSVSTYTEGGGGAGYELTVAMNQGGAPPIAVGPQLTMNYSGGVLGDTATISLFLDPEYEVPAD